MSKLRKEIEYAINCNSAENGSNTPDFILAEYLTDCLSAHDKAVTSLEKWYGGEPIPVDAPTVLCDCANPGPHYKPGAGGKFCAVCGKDILSNSTCQP